MPLANKWIIGFVHYYSIPGVVSKLEILEFTHLPVGRQACLTGRQGVRKELPRMQYLYIQLLTICVLCASLSVLLPKAFLRKREI
jgi:hypothetical protein